MRTYRCHDGFCGAEDCGRCHPELQVPAECPGCGEKYPPWAFVGDLCPECESRGVKQCACCGEWLEPHQINERELCDECEKEYQMEEAV
ncbi:hypothetical protein SDC9_110422 [bioreactor metagenome]|uniref:Uncharacterized protein n=1 Tax=bioreactor metagenome TaxID=1076179 RepID=A0A645BDY1_9ZZZZ